MNHSDFNELVRLYVRAKAAELVVDSYGATAKLYVERLEMLSKMRGMITTQSAIKKKTIEEIDEKINQLNSKNTKYSTDEIEMLTIVRAIAECEYAFLTNELEKINATKLSVAKGNEQTGQWFQAVELLADSKRELFGKFKQAISDAEPNIDEDTIMSVTKYYTSSNSVVGDKSFTKNLNHACKTHFPFQVSYKELIDQLEKILSSSYIQSQLNEKQNKKIYSDLKKILSTRESKTDEQLYLECQQYAKTVNSNSPLGQICKGTANDDLILLESITLLDTVKMSNKVSQKPMSIDEFRPSFYDKKIKKSSRDSQYSSIVDLYLQYRSADLVSKMAIEQMQVLFSLNHEILLKIGKSQQEISSLKREINEKQEEQSKSVTKTQNALEKYPESSELINKLGNESVEKTTSAVRIFSMLQFVEEEKMKGLKLDHVSRLLTYREQFVQCICLIQLTASLEAQLQSEILSFTKKSQAETQEKFSDETREVFARSVINPTYMLEEKPFTSRLNWLASESHEYMKSYESFNELIRKLTNHDQWKALKKQGINISPIEKLSSFLNKISDQNAENRFNEINKFVAEQLKAIRFPWEEKHHPRVASFLKAALDKDILKLQSYMLELDYLPVVEKNKQFKL